MNLTIGQKMNNGKYTIERELAQGRFSITYLTRRSDGERWIIKILNQQALKVLAPDVGKQLENMFVQESFQLARCSGHPNIVRVEVPFWEGSLMCLPMEYIDGPSLATRGQRQIPEKLALDYVAQIGRALEVLHGKALLHRDVRPGNILLRIIDGKTEPVLTGFELALEFDSENTRVKEQERISEFSPIELVENTIKTGPYTDVYSLAATLYDLLTGVPPKKASDRIHDSAIFPQSLNSEISPKINKAIIEGMKLNPFDRPCDIKSWFKMLGTDEIKNNISPSKDINWTKWQAIWGAVAGLVALIAMIQTWFPKPDAQNLNSSPKNQSSQEK